MGKTKTADAFRWKGEQNSVQNFLNMCFTTVGLAEGTNDATVKTANTATYIVDGIHAAKTATDNVAIPAGTVIPISSYCKFLVSLDVSGNFTVTQGTYASTSAGAVLPDCPASNTPIGYFLIATDATHPYTPGTTDNSAAGITDTYVDLGCMPDSL